MFIMNGNVILCTSLVLAALFAAAGCTGSAPQQPAATPVATPIPAQALSDTALPTQTAGASLKPQPTDTLPAQWPLSFNVEKSGTYSTTIITHFDGGKGLSAVSRIDVRVTRNDGSVVTGFIKPMKGETLEIEGTKGTDRVEVTVTMTSGSRYKVIDQGIPYKTHG